MMSSSQMGVLLVGVSAVIWSTVGLFATGIEADIWVILFWRGIFSSMTLCVYLSVREGKGLGGEIRKMGRPGWTAAIIGAAATVCFISAFKFTSIANVSIIYAIVPFIAAGFAWIWMGEKTSKITLAAALVSLIGVTIMVDGSSGLSLYGDILAILMSLGMAALVVIFRKYPNKPMVMSVVASALLHVVISAFISQPLAVSQKDLFLLVLFGVVFSAATVFMIEGTKRISASQSALISTMESPLAPLWAWLIFAQFPLFHTWVGGGLVLSAVIGNVLYEYLQSHQEPKPGKVEFQQFDT